MTGIKSIKWAYLLIAVFGMFALSGCNKKNTVFITYHPLKLGNKLYVNQQLTQLDAGPNRLWMVYCISKIKNMEANAIDFQFDASDFYIESGQALQVGAQAMSSWAWNIQEPVVAKNSTEYNLGTIVFSVELPDINQPDWVNLYYKTTGSESVFMVKHVTSPPAPVLNNSLSQVSLPQNCPDGKNIPD